MNRVIGAAATVLAAACLVSGCAGSTSPAAQPTAIAGALTQSQGAIPSAGAVPTATTAAATTTATSALTGLSSSELNAAITTAEAHTTAVHITGTVVSVSSPLNLDAQLNGNGTSSGTLGFDGATSPFLVAGGVEYFQLTTSLMALEKLTDPSAKDMWVTSTSYYGEGQATLFSQFMTFGKVLSSGLVGNGDTFTYEGVKPLGSQHVAVYQESGGEGQRFDYDFPTAGAALPLKASGGDSTTAMNLTFTWNQPTTVEAPSVAELYTGKKQ